MICLSFYGKSASIGIILKELPDGMEAIAVNIEQPSTDSAIMCQFRGPELDSHALSGFLLSKLKLIETLTLDDVQVDLHITVIDRQSFNFQAEVIFRLADLNIGLVVEVQ